MTRTPAEHRAIVAANDNGPARPHRASTWPQGERLANAGKAAHVAALQDWQRLNAAPVLCVANDNWSEDPDDIPSPSFDNRMETWTAERIIARQAAGKSWRPPDEVFDRPRRNAPERSVPIGIYKANGLVLYQISADAEDETNRAISCADIRTKLGPVPCLLLDEASAYSTTEDIAKAIKCGFDATEKYIDAAIDRFIALVA